MFNCFGPKIKSKNIIVVGMEAAGKTTIVYRTKFDGYNDYIHTRPTRGFNQEVITRPAGKKFMVRMNVSDLPGNDVLRPIWKNFIHADVDGIVFVVDACLALTSQEYLYDSKDIFWRMLDEHQELDTVPLVIFLNKMDKAKYELRSYPETFIISKWLARIYELDQLRNRSYTIRPCSMKRLDTILHGMDWLISKMVSPASGKDKEDKADKKLKSTNPTTTAP